MVELFIVVLFDSDVNVHVAAIVRVVTLAIVSAEVLAIVSVVELFAVVVHVVAVVEG